MQTIRDLIEFLDYLREKHICFSLSQMRPDSVMVSFTQIGIRYEVDFFEDHIEYSYFTGNEDVFDDETALKTMIEARASDD